MLCFYNPSSVLHLSVIGWDRQSVIRQRGGEAGRNRRARDPVGVDVLAVATQGALVLQGTLGALSRRFGWLRLHWLRLATGLLGVGAEVCGVQTVPCGGDGAGRSQDRQGILKHFKASSTRNACFMAGKATLNCHVLLWSLTWCSGHIQREKMTAAHWDTACSTAFKGTFRLTEDPRVHYCTMFRPLKPVCHIAAQG